MFSSRRGVYTVVDAKAVGRRKPKPEDAVIVIYNNNFFGARGREVDELRELLAGVGIKELGYAEYPDTGRDEGYTFAMVVDARSDQENLVANLARQAADAAMKRLQDEKQ
jgi:hypothetical protein